MQKRKLFNYFISLIAGMMFFASCTSDLIKPESSSNKPGDSISYSADVQPIFTKNCVGCHGVGATPPDLTAANSYTNLTSLGLINAANPSKSTIYVEISTGSMAAYCTPTDASTIHTWIEQGAKNN